MPKYRIWLIPQEAKYIDIETEDLADALDYAYNLTDDQWVYDYVEELDA